MAKRKNPGEAGAGKEKNGKKEDERKVLEPFNYWAQNPASSSAVLQRTITVLLLPNEEQEQRLQELAKTSTRLIETVWKKLRKRETPVSLKKLYHDPQLAQFKSILGSRNFREAIRMALEAWRAFLELKKINPKAKPPKRKERPTLYVHNRNFKLKLDENTGRGTLRLKYYWHLEIPAATHTSWKKEQIVHTGRMAITRDDNGKWYARLSVSVAINRTLLQQRRAVGVDLGFRILAAAVGEPIERRALALLLKNAYLYDYYRLKRKIARLSRMISHETDTRRREELRMKRLKLYYQLRRRKLATIRTLAAFLVKTVKRKGYTTIVVGYPRGILRRRPSEENSVWAYYRTLKEIARVAENYGLEVYAANEAYTSSVCAFHGLEVERGPRGLITCPAGHKLHADLNAALNFLRLWNPAAIAAMPRDLEVRSYCVGPGYIRWLGRRRES